MCRKSRSFLLFGNISYGLKAPNVLQLEDPLYTDLWNGKLDIVMIGYMLKRGAKCPPTYFGVVVVMKVSPLKLRLA